MIGDTAGVLTPVVEYLNREGHQAIIIAPRRQDAFRLISSSPYSILTDSAFNLYKTIFLQILKISPDIIHLNTYHRMLPILRIMAPFTRIVFQYHGSEVRGRQDVHHEARLADKICVSSPDLLRYGEVLDRPVRDIFYPRGRQEENTALMFYADNFPADQRELGKKWCEERGIRLTLVDRTEGHPGYSQSELPDVMSRHEFFLDFKGILGVLSLSALEALRCGCKVIHDSNLDNVITEYEYSTMDDYVEFYQNLPRPERFLAIKRIPRLLYSLVLSLYSMAKS